MQRARVNTKLLKIFLFQIALISGATLLGVYVAAKVAENVLVKQALEGEAAYYWKRKAQQPDAPLPNTLNLLGYMHDPARGMTTPAWLRDLPPGMHRVKHMDQQPIVHVTEHAGKTLYLVFNEQQVSKLSFYFGVVPLAGALLVLYALAYFAYIQAKRAISPIVRVAEEMARFDVNAAARTAPDFSALRNDSDAETAALMDAIDAFLARMRRFIERERNFTRYASHELRTPLAVIKGSLANLDTLPADEKQQRHLQRISNTVKDMEALLETLLMLAREDELQDGGEEILVNDVAALLIDQHRQQCNGKPVALQLRQNDFLTTRAPHRLVAIVLGNLLRNALTYTEAGSITINISAHSFSVEDTGIGIPAHEIGHVFDPFYRSQNNQQKGFGLGLAIVQKICDQLGWKITVTSEEGKGSCFMVTTAPARA